MAVVYKPAIKKNTETNKKTITKYASVIHNRGSFNSINEVVAVTKGGKSQPMATIKPVVHHKPTNKTIVKQETVIKTDKIKDNIKKCIYTCITGGYDDLRDPKVVSPNFDYICFTDKPIESKIWKMRELPEEVKDLSNVKKQRYVKINPHKILADYDLSIWVDGCIELRGDVNKLIPTLPKDYSLYIPQHPVRNCIYKEEKACAQLKKDDPKIMEAQMERYKKEGFPSNYGLPQSNILIRKHNDMNCIKIMESWWEEILNGSHRDQLSFNYAAWKNEDVKFFYLDKWIYRSKWFLWNGKHAKNNKK